MSERDFTDDDSSDDITVTLTAFEAGVVTGVFDMYLGRKAHSSEDRPTVSAVIEIVKTRIDQALLADL